MATMVVRRQKETRVNKVFMHKLADIRGGVSIKTSELGGNYVPEGAIISVPDSGICHLVKCAKLTEKYSGDTTLHVSKNSCFKVGDFVMTKVAGKANAITAIDYSNKDYDVITLDNAIDTAKQNEFIMEAKAKVESKSVLKYEPFALVGTGKAFKAGDNFDTDAWVIGVTKGNDLPEVISEKLKGIINY